LQGEDSFLDGLPDSHRQKTWDALAERCREVDLFIAPSRYFGDMMARRLNIPPEKVRVIYNGIQLIGWTPATTPPNPPVLGFFARMCKEKGLHTLVDTFVILKRRNRIPNLKLHVGGAMGPVDESFVKDLKSRLQSHNLLGEATFFPNISKEQKQQFFRRISALCVPAMYGEAFGLYLIESLAAGTPVVQPPAASFPELIAETEGGVVAKSADPEALADAIEQLLLDEPARARAGGAARAAIEQRFTSEQMAKEFIEAYSSLVQPALQIPA
jgi:glycosyltransferase involved in cell wall biosynthesis